MSSAKNIQAKVFGGQDNSNGKHSQTTGSASGSETPALSIQIPKPPALKILPQQQQQQQSTSEESLYQRRSSTNEPKHHSSYKHRLLAKLGTKYDGVERYRLEQDEKRERHWKRWGPYLSERQWVCQCAFTQLTYRLLLFLMAHHDGHRLLCARIIPATAMLGVTFLILKLVREPIDGERTVLLGYPITTNAFVSPSPSGME